MFSDAATRRALPAPEDETPQATTEDNTRGNTVLSHQTLRCNGALGCDTSAVRILAPVNAAGNR